MAIHGTHREQAEVLEPVVVGDERLRGLAHAVVEVGERLAAWQVRRELLRGTLELAVCAREAEAVEVGGHRSLRLRDAHSIVVEHDEELSVQRARVVEALHRHAVHDRRVSDDRHHAPSERVVGRPSLAVERIAARHADGGRDGRACVAYGEEVVRALAGLREPCHAAALAKLWQQVHAASEHLVRIALVTDIEEQPVVREVEDVVHRDGQLDDPEVGGEMAA